MVYIVSQVFTFLNKLLWESKTIERRHRIIAINASPSNTHTHTQITIRYNKFCTNWTPDMLDSLPPNEKKKNTLNSFKGKISFSPLFLCYTVNNWNFSCGHCLCQQQSEVPNSKSHPCHQITGHIEVFSPLGTGRGDLTHQAPSAALGCALRASDSALVILGPAIQRCNLHSNSQSQKMKCVSEHSTSQLS